MSIKRNIPKTNFRLFDEFRIKILGKFQYAIKNFV